MAMFRELLSSLFMGIRNALSANASLEDVKAQLRQSMPLSELRRAADDEGCLRVWSPPSWTAATDEAVIDMLARYYVRFSQISGTPREAFESFWHERVDEITKNVIRMRRDVYLANIQVPETFELFPGARLRPAADADDETVHRFLRFHFSARSVLELDYQIEFLEVPPQSPELAHHEAFRAAACLLSGVAPAEVIVVDQQLGIARNGGSIGFGTHPLGAPIFVDEHVVPTLVRFMRTYEELLAHEEVSSIRCIRSLKFLFEALELPPTDHEGRLMIAWISLEALMASDSARDTSQQLVANIAKLIEEDASDAQQRLGRSYFERGNYVHGREVRHLAIAAADAATFATAALRKRLGFGYVERMRR